MEKEETGGKNLICESYPGMQEVFTLALGSEYELLFVNDPAEIPLALRSHPVRLLIWDLDRTSGSIQGVLKTIRMGQPFTPPTHSQSLETLQTIRHSYPALKILLIAQEFNVGFQEDVIRNCGMTSFRTKPFEDTKALAEQIKVMIGDKQSTIRSWMFRAPLAGKILAQEKRAGSIR